MIVKTQLMRCDNHCGATVGPHHSVVELRRLAREAKWARVETARGRLDICPECASKAGLR